MSQRTSTKPSEHGTFGAQTKQCLFCGSIMRKIDYNLLPIEGYEQFYCPSCGFIAFFVQKK